MKETIFSAESVERYLLATSLSPELQDFVVRSADAAVSDGPVVPVVFGALTDPALRAETDRAASAMPEAIVQRHGSTGTLAIYRFDQNLVNAIRVAKDDRTGVKRDPEAVAEGVPAFLGGGSPEAHQRAERRRRALRAMFLFDYIGSVGSSTGLQEAPAPAFSVAVEDSTEDATIHFEGVAPVQFPLSSRTQRLVERVMRLEGLAEARFVFRAA